MMNAYLLCAVPLLPLACVFLYLRKLSGLYPWEICRSFPDLAVLPFVGAYLLVFVALGWLARCADLWESDRARDVGTRHSPTGLPPRATTFPT